MRWDFFFRKTTPEGRRSTKQLGSSAPVREDEGESQDGGGGGRGSLEIERKRGRRRGGQGRGGEARLAPPTFPSCTSGAIKQNGKPAGPEAGSLRGKTGF